MNYDSEYECYISNSSHASKWNKKWNLILKPFDLHAPNSIQGFLYVRWIGILSMNGSSLIVRMQVRGTENRGLSPHAPTYPSRTKKETGFHMSYPGRRGLSRLQR